MSTCHTSHRYLGQSNIIVSVLVGSWVHSQHHTKTEVTWSLKQFTRISIYSVLAFGSLLHYDKTQLQMLVGAPNFWELCAFRIEMIFLIIIVVQKPETSTSLRGLFNYLMPFVIPWHFNKNNLLIVINCTEL